MKACYIPSRVNRRSWQMPKGHAGHSVLHAQHT